MDNSGIFKLLTDALAKSKDKNGNSGAPFGGLNLGGIFQALKNFSSLSQPQKQDKDGLISTSNTPQNGTENKPTSQSSIVLPPLQSGMLSVMNSHDQFIKRVKEKNKTT